MDHEPHREEGSGTEHGTARDRFVGALLGLAVGDAVGTTVEFRSPGSFQPVTDMVGGGPFGLAPGQWTDDTSMALCLAESLIERRGFDPADQMHRYVRWWREGHLSSTGTCFDIGNTVKAALETFERTGEPFSGSTDPYSAGNGSLMRLAPVVLYFASDPLQAIEYAGESSRTTHGAATCVDACRYFAGLLVGALEGRGREELLGDHFTPVPGYWAEHPLAPEIAEIARGSFKEREPPQIQGSGYVVRSLEAALWAFHRSENFRDGCLLGVNLGEDADTTAAVYGQLAGAFYGAAGIPSEWRRAVYMAEEIEAFAVGLHEAGAPTLETGAAYDSSAPDGLPGREAIRALVRFLAIFEAPDFEFATWSGPESTSEGYLLLDGYQLSPEALNFYGALYRLGFIRRFDWTKWTDQAAKHVEEPARLDQAGLEDLCRLLTTHVRADRFNDGHLVEMFENGHLTAVLRRLRELRGNA